MEAMKIYCVQDVNSLPRELTRWTDGLSFSCSLSSTQPLAIFAIGSWKEFSLDTVIEADIFLDGKRRALGQLSRADRCLYFDEEFENFTPHQVCDEDVDVKLRLTVKGELYSGMVKINKVDKAEHNVKIEACCNRHGESSVNRGERFARREENCTRSDLETKTSTQDSDKVYVRFQDILQEKCFANSEFSLETPKNKKCETPKIPKQPGKCKRESNETTPVIIHPKRKKASARIQAIKDRIKSPKITAHPRLLIRSTNGQNATNLGSHPSNRWGHTLCMVSDNEAILIGGQGEKQIYSRDSVWSLDPETRKWKLLKSEIQKPDMRMGHSATYDPTVRCIYVYGGSKNLKWFSGVHVFDIEENKWQLVKVTGKSPTRAYHTTNLYRHELWVFGGVYPKPPPDPDGCSNDMHIFSPVMGNWYLPLVQGEKPSPRSGHSATVIQDKLVVFGGWCGPICFNDLYIMDLSFVEWRKADVNGRPPKPRTWHASCALSGDRVLIHGGYNGNNALHDAHIFDLHSLSWSQIHMDICPLARAGHTLLCLPYKSENEKEDEILLFGGGDNDGQFFGDLLSVIITFQPRVL